MNSKYGTATLEKASPEEFAANFISNLPEFAQHSANAHLHRYMRTFEACPEQAGARVIDLGYGKLYCDMLAEFKGYEIEPVTGLSFDFEADRYSFDDDTFDGVLLCEVLEHFVEDPMHCMLEVHRILKPGGFFLLTTPNTASWYAIYNALGHSHPSRFAHFAPYLRKAHSIHAREYLPAEVRALMEAAGFGVETLETFDYDPTRVWPTIPHFSTEDRGETILALGRKTATPKLRYIKECYGQDVGFSEAIRYKG